MTMSILIKGLDIPKKGELQQDELILRITPEGEVAKYNKLFGYRNKYKAVDVPPHGRLIDAEFLFDRLQFADLSSSDDINTVLMTICDTPTIIEAESEEEE